MWTTRRATAADLAAIQRLFLELGVPDPPPDAAELAERMLPRVIVACRGGGDAEVVGYAHWRIYGPTAHVAHVVAAPDVRRLGVGRTLMEAVREAVTAEGCTRWYLNVKRDNAPARRLYEQHGMAVEHETWALRIAWAQIEGLAADSAAADGAAADSAAADGAAAVAYAPGPDEDAGIAARFALDTGRLASLRARPGMVMLALREDGATAGCAAFDPRFPGAAVFCAARPGLARPLLDACRAHADPTRPSFIRLAVERDRALVDALVAAGAEITLEILQLGATLCG
ncbi:MAG TPA: GNAT family N-acetyltransferase [Kofleriaceae bacterium]|nr:GNAT family N-acetyltransferase [Kofleriaceae bacterium]